jgi:hypothetical protein
MSKIERMITKVVACGDKIDTIVAGMEGAK